MIANRGAVAAALDKWNERRRGIFYPKTDIDFHRAAAEPPAVQLDRLNPRLDGDFQSIESLSGGTLHILFRVRSATRNWILKVSLEKPDFGLAIESRAMRLLRDIGLPSLEVAAFEAVDGPFILIEEARGQTLTQFEHPDTQQMPEPLLFEFGRFLAKVHQTPAKGGGLLDCSHDEWTGLHQTWTDYLRLRLDEHLEVCRNIGAIDSTEALAIQKFFSEIPSVSPRLLHGDPGHHNVFSDGQKITAIIDWEDALAGDPIFDIAYWGTFVRDEMRQRFLDGYQTVEKLPPDFEHRYWLYYLRVALSKTVHRHRFGTKDRPGRPPASLRIQKALSKLAQL
jgi:aminoglycoside phosphotransferase (APT) family kinase protein